MNIKGIYFRPFIPSRPQKDQMRLSGKGASENKLDVKGRSLASESHYKSRLKEDIKKKTQKN